MAVKPPYAPNVVNQTVSYGGATWKGNPGSDWTLESVGSGGSSGGDYSSFMKDWTAKQEATNAAAAARESDFLGRFRGAIGGQEALPAMASRIGNELGLPALQKNVTDLSTLLQNMPYTQKDATRGTDVNQNQLDRIIASKASALAPTVTGVSNAYKAATDTLNTQLGYGVQQQQKELLPFQTEASMLSDRAAREVTGYTSAMQGELSLLLQKMSIDAQMTRDELNRTQELAMKEQEFENASRYLSGTSFYDTQNQSWITKSTATGGGSSIEKYLPDKSMPNYFKPISYLS